MKAGRKQEVFMRYREMETAAAHQVCVVKTKRFSGTYIGVTEALCEERLHFFVKNQHASE